MAVVLRAPVLRLAQIGLQLGVYLSISVHGSAVCEPESESPRLLIVTVDLLQQNYIVHVLKKMEQKRSQTYVFACHVDLAL